MTEVEIEDEDEDEWISKANNWWRRANEDLKRGKKINEVEIEREDEEWMK